MADPHPRPGERWRVTIEGVIDHVEEDAGPHSWARFGDVGVRLSAGSWERLPDPEPVWQPGDVVLDAADNLWRRSEGNRWESPGAETDFADEAATRPLQRLVPEPHLDKASERPVVVVDLHFGGAKPVLTAEAAIRELRKHIRNNGGHCG